MTEATSKPISRRTVAKGAAWTAPVILGGVAAPAYAASGGKPTIVPGAACKQPGNSCNSGQTQYGINKGYVFSFQITNTSSKTIYLYSGGTYPTYGPEITTTGTDAIPLTYAGGRIGGVYYAPGTPIPVPAGQTVTFLLGVNGEADSSNRVFTMNVKFQWGHTSDPTLDTEHTNDPLTASVSVDGTPTCDKCAPPTTTTTSTTSTSSSSSAARSSAPAEAPTTSQAPAVEPAAPVSTAAPTAP